MNQDLKLYTKYKVSDIAWVEKIPEHWEMKKLRTLLKSVNMRNGSDLPLLSVVREKGVIPRNISSKEENHNYIPDDLSNYKIVRSEQFAMNKMKAWQGSYGISKYDGIVSPAYFVFDLKGVSVEYFHTAIRSQAYIPLFTQSSDGIRVGQWDLSKSRMKEIPFYIPPIDEQIAIVRFLDYSDRRIKRYIRAKQKLIKLLNEQKQAIIRQAVTRGLDPNVRLTPSGEGWLGEVPEHWEIKKLKNLMNFQGGGTPSKANESYWKGDIPWVSPKDMKSEIIEDAEDHITSQAITESSTRLIPSGTILLVVRSGILRRTIPIAQTNCDVAINQDMKALIPKGNILPEYFIFFTRGCEKELLNEWTKQGATVESIEHKYLSNSKVPIPPYEEQKEITQFLKKETLKISELVDQAKKEITLLREYRIRLIADVVTGKLDVRTTTAQLPEEIQEQEVLEEEPVIEDEEQEEPENELAEDEGEA